MSDDRVRAMQAPGVVDVRLWGGARDVTRLADRLGQMPGVTVLKRSEPLVTRQGSGRRIYLTVLMDESADD